MTNAARPSLGRRIYLALFRIFGPADVKPVEPSRPREHEDRTVPPGYRLETITDAGGIRRRIAVPEEKD